MLEIGSVVRYFKFDVVPWLIDFLHRILSLYRGQYPHKDEDQ